MRALALEIALAVIETVEELYSNLIAFSSVALFIHLIASISQLQ